ncbi:MAG TPA: OpgC domain-containing protein [Thermoanaerobaculia bacterium]|nr:OpgC domain-containing protein [Thermoanaerobaculia bacterium]
MTTNLKLVEGTADTTPPPAALPRAEERDLRIDFLRGAVMVVLLTIHVELFSYLNLITWERFGTISGGEGFVILSGVVIGMIYRKRLEREGMKAALWKLYDRAAQLYRVNVAVVVGVFLLSLVPFWNSAELISFTDRFAAKTYQLYPGPGVPLAEKIARVFLLRAGPHQVQILGLYVMLLILTPLILLLLQLKRTRLLLALSWIVYFYSAAYGAMPTGAQFEYAFPLLTWQILYVHGLTVGYHRETLKKALTGGRRKAVLIAAGIVAMAGFFLAQNTTNPVLPAWARLTIIPPAVFNSFYTLFCQKNALGLFRLLDYAAALTVAYWLLGKGWPAFNRTLGWLLIPLGQASLYVFVVHLIFVLIISNLVPFGYRIDPRSTLMATLIHASVIGAIWLMVRHKVLFRWIPR